MSDIAISLRSSTERHGDSSESVVFHSFYEVYCVCWLVGRVWLWLLFSFCLLLFVVEWVTP